MKQVISGISGLDEIIGGGLIRPSIILIAGVTGTGKTTSTMQSIFNAAREDEICMYITAMSEPIAMVNNFMSKFSFYNISLMGKGNVKYLPLNHVHIKEGTLSIMKEIERNIEIIKPDRIVIDPINVLTTWMDKGEKREFYYDLFIKIKEWNSLVLVTAELSEEETWKDEISYIVDGIIYLSNERSRDKRIRYMEVLKMRGQDYQSGKHTYNITKDGLVIHPSLHPGERTQLRFERIKTGIKGLDKMTGGGLVRGTNILLSGGSGTGKTLIGLQFLIEGTSIGENGVFISFEEDRNLLNNNAKSFGWDIEKLEEEGLLKVLYTSADQLNINKNALAIKRVVEEIGAKRVVIDGINNFRYILNDNVKIFEHVNILAAYLASRNITTIFTNEVSELMGSSTISGDETSIIMDSIILLRYVEIESEMKKAISVLKMRGSDHDKGIRELVISKNGIEIKLPFTEYSGLMSGNPVKTPLQAFEEAFRK
jgi:circadian clock protein KaiC